MAICPFANYKQVTVPNRAKGNSGARALTEPNRISLHTAVSNDDDLFEWSNSTAADGVFAHFYVGETGVITQLQDTDWQATSDLDGNPKVIAIESWDGNSNPTKAFTPAQIESTVKLLVWIFETHTTIPQKLATSNLPGESEGLGWHRQGVPGFSEYTEDDGGVMYSKVNRKVCPGDAKIAQIPSIFTKTMAVLSPPALEYMTDSSFEQVMRSVPMIKVGSNISDPDRKEWSWTHWADNLRRMLVETNEKIDKLTQPVMDEDRLREIIQEEVNKAMTTIDARIVIYNKETE